MVNLIGKVGQNESLIGGVEDDLIVGNTGGDFLSGNGGEDTIIASINNDTLNGGDGNDSLLGNSGNDSLDGGTGNDILNGGADRDTLLGNDGADTLLAGVGDDLLVGGAGNDSFIISGSSNNTIDGGAGIDKLDYTKLRRAISFKNRDSVEKKERGGKITTDKIANIETIIAPVLNQNLTSDLNTIDGSGVGSITDTFAIDLALNTLTVSDVTSSANKVTFELINFEAVIGTPNNDTIAGSSGNDRLDGAGGADSLIASLGSDTIVGGAGADTLDYSALDRVITLQNNGFVQKGNLNDAGVGAFGTDKLESKNPIDIVNTIVAPVGLDNTIDGRNSNADASFDLNLATGQLDINVGGTTATVSKFNALNFVNVFGTEGNDTIAGTNNDNNLNGSGGNDIIIPGEGNDSIDGGSGSDTVDYSSLNGAITLQSRGIIDKGILGADTIGASNGQQTVARIIANPAQKNIIDGSNDNGVASFDVNLGSNSLIVNNIGGNNLVFGVENLALHLCRMIFKQGSFDSEDNELII